MKIIDQSHKILQITTEPLKLIERAGRTCYQSFDLIQEESEKKFAKMIGNKKHLTVYEHASATVRLITNRSVTHELVRHRLCSFSQESTRYVKYDGDMEFIRPVWFNDLTLTEDGDDFEADFDEAPDRTIRIEEWIKAMQNAESAYLAQINAGSRPEQAREVLPNSLKTEIVVTANLREWRHIFNLRCAKQAHPQIRALMLSVLAGFYEAVPVIFNDLAVEYLGYIPRNVMLAYLKASDVEGMANAQN